MTIIFGLFTAGRVQTADLRLVTTQFFHICFIPLIPIRGVEVRRCGLVADDGHVIPLNLKSVLHAYLRAVLFVAAIGGSIVALDANPNQLFPLETQAKIGLTVTLNAGVLWLWTMVDAWRLRHEVGFNTTWQTRTEAPYERQRKKQMGITLAVGIAVVGIGIAVSFFGVGVQRAENVIPWQRGITDVLKDETISDAQALEELAQSVFLPAVTKTVARQTEEGANVTIHYHAEAELTRKSIDAFTRLVRRFLGSAAIRDLDEVTITLLYQEKALLRIQVSEREVRRLMGIPSVRRLHEAGFLTCLVGKLDDYLSHTPDQMD